VLAIAGRATAAADGADKQPRVYPGEIRTDCTDMCLDGPPCSENEHINHYYLEDFGLWTGEHHSCAAAEHSCNSSWHNCRQDDEEVPEPSVISAELDVARVTDPRLWARVTTLAREAGASITMAGDGSFVLNKNCGPIMRIASGNSIGQL
jgi:hypothetical protein